MPNGDGIGLKNLEAALREALGAAYQMRVLTGVTATGGSNTTLEDATQTWGIDQYKGDEVRFTIDAVNYRQVMTSNIATELTFYALPPGVTVTAGLAYEIWRYVGISDISDRAARLLGVIYGSQAQQILQRATTYDLLIQLRHAGVEIDPRIITERAISKTIRDIAPGATGTFWLPETGNIDLSKYLASSWGIYAPTTDTMVINCYLNISHDGGTTWRRAAGYEILDADFVRDVWNTIDCPLKLAEAKLEVVITVAHPAELDLMCIAKP